jgi:hypothetical protein
VNPRDGLDFIYDLLLPQFLSEFLEVLLQVHTPHLGGGKHLQTLSLLLHIDVLLASLQVVRVLLDQGLGVYLDFGLWLLEEVLSRVFQDWLSGGSGVHDEKTRIFFLLIFLKRP